MPRCCPPGLRRPHRRALGAAYPDYAAADEAARKAAAGAKRAPADVTEVEERSLDTFDRIFGVIDGGLSTSEGTS
ncbi:hypothetical protein [Streptomyces tendae]|uniref:hypothetical protein n=1 Tax=Streptomyces tendae TaxID=1932 RepID=UPI003D75E252